MKWSLVLILVLYPLRVGAVSPQQALAACVQDARGLGPDRAYRTRYLWQPILKDTDQAVLTAQANFLSREPEFGKLREIDTGVWAVILDEYQWAPEQWEKLAGQDPWLHYTVKQNWPGGYDKGVYYAAGSYDVLYPAPLLDKALVDELYALTGSKVPLVRADWWFFRSSRQLDLQNKDDHGIGYYDWLEIKDRKTFEALGAVDRKTSIRLGKELLAAIEQGASGVVQYDRLVEWYAAYDGDYWLTLDTDNNHGNLVTANLERGAFKHKFEEAYITLPNELWAVYVGNDKGERQNAAPDVLGPNDNPLRRGRDSRIHIGIACFQCHVDGGLKDVDDWVRRTLRTPANLDTYDYKKYLELKRQYFSDLQARIERGRTRYKLALQECCGLEADKFPALYSEFYYRYQEARSLQTLAVEIGCEEAELKEALADYFDQKEYTDPFERKRLTPLLGLLQGQKLPITNAEQLNADLQLLVLRKRASK